MKIVGKSLMKIIYLILVALCDFDRCFRFFVPFSQTIDHTMTCLEEIIGTVGRNSLRYK